MNSDAKKIFKIACLAVFFLFIIVYAGLGAKNMILGVKIINVNIDGLPAQTGAKMADSVIKITGNAKNAVNLSLNGREISIDQQGNFEETIALLSGYNVIDIKAKDKFGNVDEKNYKLMY